MKLTIWQQFSSNHSAGFTVVGEFKTREEADKAAQEFITLIETVRNSRSGGDVTGYEYAIGLEYGIEWEHHLDWAENRNQVAQFDNYVMVSNNLYDGLIRTDYIDRMMKKLAETVYISHDITVDEIAVELTCKVSESEKDKKLCSTMKHYFDLVRAEKAHEIETPWVEVAKHIFDYDSFETPEDVYHGVVECDGQQLYFKNTRFMSIGYGLPALIAYLKQEGCTDIKYTIGIRNMWDLDDK